MSLEWAQSWAGKNSQYTALLERAARVKAASGTVVVHSFYEPRQSDWEAAYLEQIEDSSLPIQPGCKLLWYDGRNGVVRMYSTSYDIQGSNGTSGVARRIINPEKVNQDSISSEYRIRSAGHVANTYIKGNTLYTGFLLDPVAFANRKNLRFKAFLNVAPDSGYFSTYNANWSIMNNLVFYLGVNNRDGARLNPPVAAMDYRSWRVNFVWSWTGVTATAVPTASHADDTNSNTLMQISGSANSNFLKMMIDIVLHHDDWGGKWALISGVYNAVSNSVIDAQTGVFGAARRNTIRPGELSQIFGDVSPSSMNENRANKYLFTRGAMLAYTTIPFAETREFV